jgi:inhibitor of cysteine peptidase
MSKSPIEVLEKDCGQAFDLAIGDELHLTLKENPTTGFRWRLQEASVQVCRAVEDQFETTTHHYGGGGVHWWRFEAIASGQATIELTYVRPWSPDAVADRFEIQVRVSDRRL